MTTLIINAESATCYDGQYFFEGNGVTRRALELFQDNHITLGDLVLFAAALENCEHVYGPSGQKNTRASAPFRARP